MTRITWNTSIGGLPRIDNAFSVPRRPVVWWGEVWLRMPDGSQSTREWRSTHKITRQDAQAVLAAMLDDLIEECGADAAVDSGFRMECR